MWWTFQGAGEKRPFREISWEKKMDNFSYAILREKFFDMSNNRPFIKDKAWLSQFLIIIRRYGAIISRFCHDFGKPGTVALKFAHAVSDNSHKNKNSGH